MQNKVSRVFWSAVVLAVPILAMRACGEPVQAGADTPPQAPKPTLPGRWVSTEFANEILEFSPSGEVKITYRGNPNVYTGQYQYAGDILKMILNWNNGRRTVEHKVLALSHGEMTLLLPRLTGLREERRVTYWRIDPKDYGRLRTQLLGKWQATGPFGETLEFAPDDTMTATMNGRQYVGIYRVVGRTLEYHLNTERAAPIARMTVEAVSDTNLSFVSPNNKRADYRRARGPN